VGSQLVGERDPGADEVFAGAHERAQRERLIAAGRQRREAMVVGAAELAQHHRVEPVGLAGGGAEAVAGGGDLVGMDREHGHAGGQQPPDQQPVRALDRHPNDPMLDQQSDQAGDARLVMGQALLDQQHAGVGVGDPHVVMLGSPVDPADCGHAWSSSVEVATRQADREVPWRVLIGWPSEGRHPAAALGASHRREALISCGPSARLASSALSRRWSALYAAQSQGRPSLRSGLITHQGKETCPTAQRTPEVAL
jgi:hypothetical protein